MHTSSPALAGGVGSTPASLGRGVEWGKRDGPNIDGGAPLCTPAQGGGLGSPPLCTLAHGNGTGTPTPGHRTWCRCPRRRDCIPLCTTAQGRGIGFPSTVHHSIGRRDNVPHLCAPWRMAEGQVSHPFAPWHRVEGQVPDPCAHRHMVEGLVPCPTHHSIGWRDRVSHPCAPQHKAEGPRSPPLCTTTHGRGTAFRTPVHHNTSWRDCVPHRVPHHKAEGPRSPPLCTTAHGGGKGLHPAHHSVAPRDSVALPCAHTQGIRLPACSVQEGWRSQACGILAQSGAGGVAVGVKWRRGGGGGGGGGLDCALAAAIIFVPLQRQQGDVLWQHQQVLRHGSGHRVLHFGT